MTVNLYRATPSGPYTEAPLYESMIIESIQWAGHDIYYIPRSVNQFDQIYGEDVLASFDVVAQIEVYLNSVTGYDGGAMISKFGGYSLNQSSSFSISKSRFLEVVTPLLANSKLNKNTALQQRPNEGDLIYFPETKSLFEIKYVEGYEPFRQLQDRFVWTLTCKLFKYNSEKFSTGVSEIDAINDRSENRLNFVFTSEDGSMTFISDTDGGTFIQEQFDEVPVSIPDADAFKQEFLNIVDFTTDNPFSEKF